METNNDARVVRIGRRHAALYQAQNVSTTPIEHIVLGPNRTSPFLSAAILVCSDVISIIAAWVVAIYGRSYFGGEIDATLYFQMWPSVLLFVSANAVARLYPGTGFLPPEELRRLSYTTTLVFLVLAVAIFLTRGGTLFSRSIFLVAWVAALLFVPLARTLVRSIFARKSWWGQAVIVLGAGKTGAAVIEALERWPGLGLKAIVVLDDDCSKHGEIRGVPVIGPLSLTGDIAKKLGVHRAVLAMPGVSRDQLLKLVDQHSSTIPHLALIPDLFGFSSLWVDATDLGGILALEIRQNLILRSRRVTKRVVDFVLCVCIGTVLAPVMFLVAALVWISSPGPIFFGHTRIGKDGKPFVAWKFRSMCANAEQKLHEYLDKNPDLLDEWRRDHKLRVDPRVTWIGKVLRTTSFDEMPQLWNVLLGEMSLVGPRPIVADEVGKYGDFYSVYKKVLPGITGFWQVSGRSNTSYEYRVSLDAYYVRNWSVWFDFYILAKTIKVVLFRHGAY